MFHQSRLLHSQFLTHFVENLYWFFILFFQELGHNPSHWQLQMDANRQVHILPRSHADEHEQAKVTKIYLDNFLIWSH